jgi:hypothetical protein
MEDITIRVENENEHIHDGVCLIINHLFLLSFFLFFENNQLQMGIQTLRNKEQHHAFQHATSAEV